MAEPIERGYCADCGADLAVSDPEAIGMCRHCGAYAPKPPRSPFRDPRRRHTPEEAARRKKHGDAG